MDFDSTADELYGLPLDTFVTTRNARAKQARADGDRELAAEIQALTKPTTAAWLVNQLSRERSDDLDPLLDLGRELRDASAKLDGETMRSLGRRRSELVAQLLSAVRDIGKAHGYQVSDDVADEVRRSLEATLSDSTIADEVASGRLTRAVEYAGFGEFTGLGGPTGIVGRPRRERPAKPTEQKASPDRAGTKSSKSTKSAKRSSQPTDLNARRRRRAEQEVEEAARRLEKAQSGREEAAEEYERTAAEVEETEAEVERLRAELSTAEKAAKAARQAHRSAQQRLSNAEREVGGVQRVYERANAKLEELSE